MATNESGAGGSLSDRVTKPEGTATGLQGGAASFQPSSGRSWADEVNSPLDGPSLDSAPVPQTQTSKPEESATIPQNDGAAEPFGGSGLNEPEYEVNIKLADMQADPNNPLFSAKTFEELNLYVSSVFE